MRYGFGVDIGGTTVKLAFFSQNGTCLEKWEIPTRKAENGRQILPDVAEAVVAYLEKGRYAAADIMGIGIGVPGAVTSGGVVNRCVNLGWGKVNVCEELGKLTGLPVVAGNDASLAALGESRKCGCRNMVLVTLGTGIGAGIVIDGKVVYGSHGAAGEIGHIIQDPLEDETCSCGNAGCAEQYCSATGIVRLMKKHLATGRTQTALSDRDFSCADVFAAAADDDISAVAVLEQVYSSLGMLIAGVCCVTDPEVVALGGGVSEAGQPLLEGAKRYFEKYCFHACQDTKFVLATLGNDAGIHGAFQLLLDEYL